MMCEHASAEEPSISLCIFFQINCKVVLVSKYRRFSRLVRVNVYARLGRSLCRHQIHAAATETHVFWLVKNSINTEPWHCEDERCRASSEKVCSMFIKNQTFLCTTSTCIFLNYFFPFIDDILNIPSHSTIRCGPLKQRTDVKGVVFNFKDNDCDLRVCNISSEIHLDHWFLFHLQTVAPKWIKLLCFLLNCP